MNQWTHGPMDRQTNIPSYKDVMAHLKSGQKRGQNGQVDFFCKLCHCPLSMIYRANSSYHIQWYCVIACLQYDRYNLRDALYAAISLPDSIDTVLFRLRPLPLITPPLLGTADVIQWKVLKSKLASKMPQFYILGKT